MRITPSKWDAEYGWLRDEVCRRSIGTSPRVTAGRKEGGFWSRRRSGPAKAIGPKAAGRPSNLALGLGLQAMGALAIMTVSGMESAAVSIISLMALLGGEIIFINSLGYRGYRARGDRTR